MRFDGDEAVALVDLDTFHRGLWAVEMGDALRSWCNVAAENTPTPVFDPAVFDAAVAGYVEACSDTFSPTLEEWRSLVPGLERICWELAARFARDALEECYFGFDPRFGGRGEHNLIRARGQVALAETVREKTERLERTVREALDRLEDRGVVP